MIDKFKQYIRESNQILITSHVSPDPDAVASVLLLSTTLQLNFPDKKIQMVIEEEPGSFDFLNSYGQIKFESLLASVENFKPELFIMVDVANFDRCSRLDGDRLKDYIGKNQIKTITIDHHEPVGRDEVDLYINSGNPACVQEVYELCYTKLKLKKPDGYAQTAMLGLYADTGGFAYHNPRHSATLALADELITAGADVEQIKNALYQYNQDDMRVLSELAANVSKGDDYTYSFIRDEFVEQWLKSGKSGAELHRGTEAFVNDFVRNIGGRKWGFIVYRNPLYNDGTYSVSLRSVGIAQDVSEIARKLSGGGHKPAAGGKVQAGSLEEALAVVQKTIVED